MKALKKIIYLFIILGLMSQYGCESVLEKTPDGQITLDEILNNYDRSKGLSMKHTVKFTLQEIRSLSSSTRLMPCRIMLFGQLHITRTSGTTVLCH